MRIKEKGNNKEKKKLSRKQKILITSIALITGLSGTVVGSSLIAYNALFPRYERPDYSITAGNYFYERVKTTLYRENLTFNSNGENLSAYYYPANNGKGLVLVAHGLHAGGDDFIPMIEYLVQNDYNVFTYDMTGTYSSGGKDTVGWCQSLVDIDYAIRFLKSDARFSNQPLFLIGHSWGGYAVTSVLSIHKNILACVGIAPMCDGSTIMMQKAEEYVGVLSNVPKPIINAYQKVVFGDYVKHNGVKGINSVDIPVLIAQGVDDKVITYDGQSITAYRDEITNPNVTYYEGTGLQGGHDSIWHSVDSIVYQKEVESKLNKLKRDNDGKLSYSQKVEFFKTVDHRLYSEVNKELMDKIIKLFETTL